MSQQESSGAQFTFGKANLMPQEEMLEVKKARKQLIIGIPKEAQKLESRVALTPEAVEQLVELGHTVFIESEAGKAANYLNTNYSELGGTIVEDKKQVFQSDIILKIAPLTLEEVELLNERQVVISSLHLNNQTEELIRKIMARKVTAIAFENIRDEHNCYPVVRSMSSIAGNTSILIAAEYLSNNRGGKGVMLGGIPGITPTEVIILGAGTAAESAVRAALGLGAHVKVFDNSVHRLRRLQNNIGERVYTSIFHKQVMRKTLKSADVVIGAMYLIGKGPRYIITEDMVKEMKKGSVIVDISIDQGGCIETSECRTQQDPVYTKHGVIHYCVPNLPSRVARTASIAISNVFAPLLASLGESGGIKTFLREDAGTRNGVYIFNGILTNHYIGQHLGIPSKDIELLMAAF
ncbi:MAG: alanine dehydrogenase [Bacteroidales bacterium]|nr:alanine dehydrogenase [Bacteroidales bacterium]